MRIFSSLVLWLVVAALAACSQCADQNGCAAATAAPGTGADAVPNPPLGAFTIVVSPSPASVNVGAQATFTATLSNPPAAVTAADVQWTLSGVDCAPPTCGTLSSTSGASVTYTAPVLPPTPNANVTARASAGGVSGSAMFVVVNDSANNAALNGDYAFQFFGFDLPPQHFPNVTIDTGGIGLAGHFHADGHGHLSGAEIDADYSTGTHHWAGQIGIYEIGADGRGTLVLNTGTTSVTFRFVLVASTGSGRMIEFDSTLGHGRIGTGEFRKQDRAAFDVATFSGDYAFGFIGEIPGNAPLGRFAIAGHFKGDASGHLLNGRYEGPSSLQSDISASFSAVDPTTGRGTSAWTMPSFNATPGLDPTFAYYIVDSTHVFFITTDGRQQSAPDFQGKAFLVGEARAQKLPPIGQQLSGAAIYYTTGVTFARDPMTGIVKYDPAPTAGRLVFAPGAGSSGTIPEGRLDQVRQGVGTPSLVASGTYGVSISPVDYGRARLTFLVDGVPRTVTVYLTAANEGFVVGTQDSRNGFYNEFGTLEPQLDVAAGIEGDLVGATVLPGLGSVPNGAFTLRLANGSATGVADVSSTAGLAAEAAFDGTYAIGSEGSSSLVLSAGGPAGLSGDFHLWHIRPGRLLVLPMLNNGSAPPAVSIAER